VTLRALLPLYLHHKSQRLKMKTVRLLFTVIALIFINISAQGSIYCPPDQSIYCDSPLNISVGTPTVIGYPMSIVKYKDHMNLNQCKVGTITRTWYIDVNQNNQLDSGEGNCTQIITVLARASYTNIVWPENKTFNCLEEIVREQPQVSYGSCDVLGYNVSEMRFDTQSDACYKIFRTHNYINWCTLEQWQHVQVIKVVDPNAPEILDCSPKTIGVGADCKAIFKIQNVARDQATCSSDRLDWQVEIDLWANGDVDHKYGYLEAGDFKIGPKKNLDTVTITLPTRIGVGRHKVYWTVKDPCGNIKTCTQIIETKDNKPPTPYLLTSLATSVNKTSHVIIRPEDYDVGSIDNCTQSKYLRYSFSSDLTDTLDTITCVQAGFLTLNIHITDEENNTSISHVNLFVHDNGDCSSGNLTSQVLTSAAQGVPGVSLSLSRSDRQDAQITDLQGEARWSSIPVYTDYKISLKEKPTYQLTPDVEDLKLLQKFIFGIVKPTHLQWIAADVNGDLKINNKDLILLRNMIMGKEKPSDPWSIYYIQDTITKMADIKLLKSEIALFSSEGDLRFTAVYRGEITDANKLLIPDQGSMISIENRTYSTIPVSFSPNPFVDKIFMDHIDFDHITAHDVNGKEIPFHLESHGLDFVDYYGVIILTLHHGDRVDHHKVLRLR
jgi:hypothetical protein